MKNKGEITDVLSELLKINNDRIGIYRQVIRKIGEHDLKIVFQGAIEESRKIQTILALEIFRRNSLPDVDATTIAGKLYRVWLEIKDFLFGQDHDSMLNACRFSEHCVEKAYREALKHDEVHGELSQILHHQIETLRRSHQMLKTHEFSY